MTYPKVTLLACMSLDGFIAQYEGDLLSWLSPEVREIYKMEKSRADVLLMGSKTYFHQELDWGKKEVMVMTRGGVNLNKVGMVLPEYAAVDHCLQHLASDGCSNVLLMGGQLTFTTLMNWDMVDEMVLVKEPVAFVNGVSLFSGMHHFSATTMRFRLLSASKLNEDGALCLRYGRRD